MTTIRSIVSTLAFLVFVSGLGLIVTTQPALANKSTECLDQIVYDNADWNARTNPTGFKLDFARAPAFCAKFYVIYVKTAVPRSKTDQHFLDLVTAYVASTQYANAPRHCPTPSQGAGLHGSTVIILGGDDGTTVVGKATSATTCASG